MTNREAIEYASKHSFLELYSKGYQDAIEEILEYSFGMVDPEKFALQHKLMKMRSEDKENAGYIEKYVTLKSIEEAGDDETVCALYPHPMENISGSKGSKRMAKAIQDAAEGKCKLLVWRKVVNEGI